MGKIEIGNDIIGDGRPCYFIAEIGANHDGSLERAKKLISLAKDAGANCAKFQYYRADTLASKYGFEQLKDLAHYTENPYDLFKKYEVPWSWTSELHEYCDKVGIEFMATPYDLEAVDHLNSCVNAFKIGSGDIDYTELLRYVASKNKPVILSIGASDYDEVSAATAYFQKTNLCLLQCNTNYSGDDGNAEYANLSLIPKLKWEAAVVGLSDHTKSWAVPPAAIALGAKVIERHFTDGMSSSPDNDFANDPTSFMFMVEDVREAEAAMGSGFKKVEENEQETVVLQRRCLRFTRSCPSGHVVTEDDLAALRPAPADSVAPGKLWEVVGKKLGKAAVEGDYVSGDILRS